MDNIFVGIDPGIKGGIAFIDERRKILALEESPPEELIAKKINGIFDILNYNFQIHFAIENVFVRTHESRIANKTIVRNMGIWLGVCYNVIATHGPSDTLENPSPREWQKPYAGMYCWRYWSSADAIITHKARKTQRAYDTVRNFFDLNYIFRIGKKGSENLKQILIGSRGGIKDGLCDALLIANWRREKYLLEQKKI